MARYAAGRVATGVATLLVVTMLVFAAIHLIPGSYSDIVLGQFATPQARAQLSAEFGLDQPLPVQYGQWLWQTVQGNLGSSFTTGQPILEQLGRRLPVTAELALLALAITLVVGLPLALLSALARTPAGRGASRLPGSLAMSVPDFVLGSLFVYLFSRYALGLRVGGYVPFVEDPVENLRSMLLPALTLSIFGIALVARTGRDAIVTVLSSPHVTAATARGESMPRIIRHHVLRNSAIPLVTVLAVYMGYLMGGSVIVENLFSMPGLGQSVLTAIGNRDYATVQGVVVVAAAAFIMVNTLADVAYGFIDPRVRTGAA